MENVYLASAIIELIHVTAQQVSAMIAEIIQLVKNVMNVHHSITVMQ